MSKPTPRSAAAAPPDAAEPQSFEQAIAELEQLVAAMEGGTLSLEASLAAYQRGALLTKYCQDRLASAEQQVRILEGDVLKNFRPGADDDEQA
jgi:exodeoxyribonuclease VII small subunit